MVSLLVAAVSGVVMVWSLVRLVRHKLNETNMGLAIYSRLRGSKPPGQTLRTMVREPLLGLTKEAAPLPETRSMLRSYWMTGLYGLIFLVSMFVCAASLIVFAVSAGLITA